MLSQLGLDPGKLRQNPAECFLGRYVLSRRRRHPAVRRVIKVTPEPHS